MNTAGRQEIVLLIEGIVQGVGFRPFVVRTAHHHQLSGWVRNDARGVTVRIRGNRCSVDAFVTDLQEKRPPASAIHKLSRQSVSEADRSVPVITKNDFIILESTKGQSSASAAVTPDLALCDDCRRELLDPGDRRFMYPFINCTNCGPRYSIVQSLPYDRPRTTMAGFPMCGQCADEYRNVLDRRYHAQPVACETCGPAVALHTRADTALQTGQPAILAAAEMLRTGSILAVKGLGGFHLFTDAASDIAVNELRKRKARDEKPLAVMFPSMESVIAHTRPDEEAIGLLKSPGAPIVLLKKRDGSCLSSNLAPGNPWIGALLPYTPLHVLLMNAVMMPMVATSANLSEEPLCTKNEEAFDRLRGIADAFLIHDRPIARPVDDSVVRVCKSGSIILRRARGLAPAPVALPDGLRADRPLLSVGGHLKNTIAYTVDDKIILSPHIGDLTNALAVTSFKETVELLSGLYGGDPGQVVCDLHPDYASTRFAEESGLPVVHVQHHLAHVLACLLEHGGGPDHVLGVSWDGTGLGDDGTIWGGEFLLVDKRGMTATRVAHMKPFRLPGGEAAAKATFRSAIGAMRAGNIIDSVEGKRVLSHIMPPGMQPNILLSALEKRVNAPLTSSAGRLFDAVACLLGLSTDNAFEGKSAMAVEFAASRCRSKPSALPWNLVPAKQDIPNWHVDWSPALQELCKRTLAGEDPEILSLAWHRTLAEMILGVAMACETRTVALTGGCFQNAILTDLARELLEQNGFTVLLHRELSPNDNSIAAGQALAALWGLNRTSNPS